MITNEEARKAIEKYQKEHPLQFGAMLDVTAISSKEGADIISQTIEKISKKVEEDTDLWCICEMAKMYMQGVRPVYPVRPQSEWIPVSERLPDDMQKVLIWFEYYRYGDFNCMYQTYGFGYVCDGKWSPFINGETGWQDYNIIAWQPLPEPYQKGGEES